jgi:23S rRNA (pseudouridine1915-N3)-methyltransferase
MQITLAHVGSRDGNEAQVEMYLGRCSGWAKCAARGFRGEDALLEWVVKQGGRTPVAAVLLDSRGRTMSSEAFAGWLGARRDDGVQHVVFAMGPASGWSEAARTRAQLLLSFGPMTLAHGLARLVMAEQIYRAVTILSGHPYHSGH